MHTSTIRFLNIVRVPSTFAAGVALGLCALSLPQARADENYFGYTYGADTLPKGHSEIYQWVTFRSGKADGHYRAFDFQTELEHGFTDRLQGSLYLNAIRHDISGVTDFEDRDQTHFNGLQGSLKYALTNLYKDNIGVALYVEPGYTRYAHVSGDREDKYFFETKIILQKNYLDGLLVWATNLEAEFEREHDLDEQEWESELELVLSTGVSYRVAPRWFVGAEAVAAAAFERMHLDELGEYGVFVGPNVHYAAERWWFTLTALAQVTGWPENSGRRNLDNFEKFQLRAKVGVNF
jgi:hypothetical protein